MRVHAERPDGTRFQHKKRFRTVEEAVKWRTTVVSEVSHGTHVAPSELTLRQAVDAWLRGQRIRPKTMSAYITSLRPLVDALGEKKVQLVTKDDIEGVVASLREGTSKLGTWHGREKITKGKEFRAKWSSASVNPMLARTRAIFSDLMDQGVLVRNVAALVKSLPTEKSTMRTLDADQVAKLLDSTRDDVFGIAWLLAIYGLRRGEIAALLWGDVDLEAKTIAITTSRVPVAGGSETGATKTRTSTRTLPMPDDLTAALKRAKKRQAEAKLALGSKWAGVKDPAKGHVVVDAFGRTPHPDTLTHAWRDALETAGLPHVRLHDARHSCATLMHMRGVPVVVIAAWLGHQDAGFTLRTYAHSTNDALTDAAGVLNSITSVKPGEAAE
ncbi:MAG: site-specific integrase [Mycobacterium sp.]|nr:site-specific integrase [Mycobacterium sp.]